MTNLETLAWAFFGLCLFAVAPIATTQRAGLRASEAKEK